MKTSIENYQGITQILTVCVFLAKGRVEDFRGDGDRGREWTFPVNDEAGEVGCGNDEPVVTETEHEKRMNKAVDEAAKKRGISTDEYWKRLRVEISKLHANLGHVSNRLLTRVLKSGGVTLAVMKVAHSLQCNICSSHANPKTSRPAKVHKASEFGEIVGIDCFDAPRWPRGAKQKFMNIVDWAT